MWDVTDLSPWHWKIRHPGSWRAWKLLGLHYRDIRHRQIVLALGIVGLAALLLPVADLPKRAKHIENASAALLYAGIGLLVKCMRDKAREGQLRSTLVVTRGLSGGREQIVQGGRVTTGVPDLRFLIRNFTAMPIEIREVRLRPEGEQPVCLTRLKPQGPSRHVGNEDPDEPNGDHMLLLPDPGIPTTGEVYMPNDPVPGKTVVIEPECGHVYGLPARIIRSGYKDKRLKECLIFVSYPTIFGGKRVLRVSVNQQAVTFIQRLIDSTIDACENIES